VQRLFACDPCLRQISCGKGCQPQHRVGVIEVVPPERCPSCDGLFGSDPSGVELTLVSESKRQGDQAECPCNGVVSRVSVLEYTA
jgi:hypothetical protein